MIRTPDALSPGDHTANIASIKTLLESVCRRHDVTPADLEIEVVGLMSRNIAIRRQMHQDEMGRPQADVVDPSKRRWTEKAERYIIAHIAKVKQLNARRQAFDPKGEGKTAPRWAWDIHPITAALLATYPKIPKFDNSHRLNGAVGREIELGPNEVLEKLLVAYGDGIVRLVHAKFPDGTAFNLHETPVPVLNSMERMPASLRQAITGKKAGDIHPLLGSAPGAHLIKVLKVDEDYEGDARFTFTNRLVPWASSRHDSASWRQTSIPKD